MAAGKVLRAAGNQHHVRAFIENGTGGLNGIFHAAETGDGSGAQCGGVHDDGVALDVAVEREMRAVARIEDRIVLKNDDGGFDGVKCVTAVSKNGPAGVERAETAGFAGINGVIGNVPGTAVNDE